MLHRLVSAASRLAHPTAPVARDLEVKVADHAGSTRLSTTLPSSAQVNPVLSQSRASNSVWTKAGEASARAKILLPTRSAHSSNSGATLVVIVGAITLSNANNRVPLGAADTA